MSGIAKKAKDKKPKTYTVHYSYYFSDSVEIEATGEDEAKKIVREMLAREEIGRVSDMDVGESKLWVG